MTDVEYAIAAIGPPVVCWFVGYASGAVARHFRRMMGKGAR